MGLVALSTLHVSHARDVQRLREWAGRADRTRPWHRRIGARHVAVVVVALLVLGGLRATGGGDTSGNPHPRKPDTPKPKHAPVKPGKVTVAVLNGTTVPGLAASLRDRLVAAGFRRGAIDVYSDQQLSESVVQYAPGRQAEAKAVGRKLSISRREPITADSRAIAGAATVIVIAGADKAP
ncbi:LytR C-terminal domain-containing protein [Solirubrobacter soli]|uniref:LytR C-terminal domain-containing protein n=1 Tax=Solirubrobacter soli TaxID=363832 RepID=UPI00041524D0|nr:LytR C-terminal domain-containing protein [Solirubrobacter soli]